jgi:hypothetical protein
MHTLTFRYLIVSKIFNFNEFFDSNTSMLWKCNAWQCVSQSKKSWGRASVFFKMSCLVAEPRWSPRRLGHFLTWDFATCRNVTCHVHVMYMSGTCHVHVRYMSCTCPVHVMYMTGTCHVYVMYMTCTCPVHVMYMTCTWHVPDMSLSISRYWALFGYPNSWQYYIYLIKGRCRYLEPVDIITWPRSILFHFVCRVELDQTNLVNSMSTLAAAVLLHPCPRAI